jgi:pimeloyl-ACP methyl ester carboxylesterase
MGRCTVHVKRNLFRIRLVKGYLSAWEVCLKVIRHLVICALTVSWLGTMVSGGAQSVETTSKTITVPLVYGDPSLGTAPLTLDFGSPFQKNRPTVIIVADGQQYYVQKGAMKALQESTFGPDVNVVGIISRGTTAAFIKASLNPEGKPDWQKAWRIFNSHEWIEDIESARKALVGENGQVYLYGRSGGAYLVHEYLTRHAAHVPKAFTQSAVNPYLNAELGITLDRFWSELGEQDPNLQNALQAALRLHPEERIGILMTLQRQHFFVSSDEIADARAALIRKLADGDLAYYKQARKDYEVDAMTEMSRSNDIIPQNVRVLELIGPSGAFEKLGDGRLYPLAETQAHAIQPLLDLQKSGKISLSPFDFAALHRSSTQVFVLSGRYDEAVDYRTDIALASRYPIHELFIANDNHVFNALASSGMSKKIIASFYEGGIGSPQLTSTLRDAQRYRWNEE